jgi:hypothetical protein
MREKKIKFLIPTKRAIWAYTYEQVTTCKAEARRKATVWTGK